MRDFNFFRSYTDTKKATKDKYFVSITVTVALAALMIGIYLYNFILITMLNNEIASIDKFIKEPGNIKKLQAFEETKEKNDIMENYYNELSVVNMNVSNKDKIDSALLRRISIAMPKDIFAEAMTINSKEIQIQGVATSRSIVAQFQHNLSKDGSFNNVYVNTMNIDSEDSTNYTFVLKCELGDVE